MTTAIIGIGNTGGTRARELASGDEAVVLSATSPDAVEKLATGDWHSGNRGLEQPGRGPTGRCGRLCPLARADEDRD